MSHILRLSSIALAFGLIVSNLDAAQTTKPAATDAKPDKPAKPDAAAAAAKEPAKPVKELNAAMTALRDRVRKTLAGVRQQPLNTRDNTCGEILQFCQAFGCETEVTEVGQSNQKVNGITCICWNIPCAGNEPLMLIGGRLAARVGYGYQDSPSQLAAVLAMAHVPLNYPARVGKSVRTVADLIEQEKLTCRAGTDMALKLIALSTYVNEPTWKNSLGEEWSLERVVHEELARTTFVGRNGVTTRLLAFAYALERTGHDDKSLGGDMLRARQYVDDSIKYAYRGQNSDGSWGRTSYNRDYSAALDSSGHMLEWLVVALPEKRLEEPQITRAVEFLDSVLGSQRYQSNVQALSSREISSVMAAAHALVVYDRRVFAPADPPPEPETEKATKSAKRTAPRQVSASMR